MNRRQRRVIAASALLLALTGLTGPPRPAFAVAGVGDSTLAPRPLSDAERAAVELAALYLDGGAGTWRARLSPENPWSALRAEEAEREIEVRAGPPEGSAWTLQTPAPGMPEEMAIFTVVFPSGAEETLTLRLAPDPAEGEGDDRPWRITEVRSLADPVSDGETESLFGGSPALPRAPSIGTPPAAGSRRAGVDGSLWLGLGLLALLIGLAATFDRLVAAPPRTALHLASTGAAAAVGVALVLVLACGGDPGSGEPAPDGGGVGVDEGMTDSGQPRLGALRELRWSLATDGDPIDFEDGQDPRQDAAGAPAELRRRVADLWRAQLLLRQVDLREAEEILSAMPDPDPVPLTDLLRARLASIRGDEAEASFRYDRVRAAGPDHDALRLETAAALSGLSFDQLAEVEAVQIAEMGSRIAEVWYIRAQIALFDGDTEASEELLRTAWAERPVERAELFDDPVLAFLTARPTLFSMIEPGSPEEPMVEPDDLATRVVPWPARARASLLGRLLRIEIGDRAAPAVIEVPGGSALAPSGAVLSNAGAWNRREQQAALARLGPITEEAGSLAAFGQPRLRRQILEAAAALAEENRWEDLVLLTDGIDDQVARVPALLVQLRAHALRQTSRAADARRLLILLAKLSMESKRPAPGVLYQLAELFVSDQEYDVALRLIRKASALSPLARNESRIRQIDLERWLYDDPERHWSDHFEIVYPRVTGDRYASQLATVLEAERERIGHWVPLETGYPIEVDLFPLARFMNAYSGGLTILGLYDGRVRVPFADIRSLHPRLVSVVSHEVAHALIGQATFDQAPNWFHEGLAQHVEMLPGRINPIPDLAREGRVIAFPLIEPILEGFAEPQLVDLAYGEAAWVVHYLEAVHGVKAIRAFVRAFRDGATTEEAIERVLGMSVAELDRSVWDWCIHDAPGSWPTELVRYDLDFDRLVKRSRPRASRRSGAGGGSSPAEAMADWYVEYSRKVAPFKETLRGILGPLRDRRSPPANVCTGLSAQIDRLLRDPVALRPPDPAVEAPLIEAFRSFGTMADACGRGQVESALRAKARAERSLGRAAAAMERYGLRP